MSADPARLIRVGEVIGILASFQPGELEQLSKVPGLHPEYAQIILRFAEFKRTMFGSNTAADGEAAAVDRDEVRVMEVIDETSTKSLLGNIGNLKVPEGTIIKSWKVE